MNMNTANILNKVLEQVEAGVFADPIAPCDREGGYWDLRAFGGTDSVVVRRGAFGARLIHDATSSCPSGLCGKRAYVHVFRDPIWWSFPRSANHGPVNGPYASKDKALAAGGDCWVVRSAHDVTLTRHVHETVYDSTDRPYSFGWDGYTQLFHQAIPLDELIARYTPVSVAQPVAQAKPADPTRVAATTPSIVAEWEARLEVIRAEERTKFERSNKLSSRIVGGTRRRRNARRRINS